MAGGDAVLYTIGHSNHSLEAFLALLKRHGIQTVADVRSQPYSRLPHFQKEELERALKADGIDYVFLGRELGARRAETECYENGQAQYDRIAATKSFLDALDRLVAEARRSRVAMMCAEKEPLDCHRTILICRHLRRSGLAIRHILADGGGEEHPATERRLVKEMGITRTLFEPNLTHAELVERAYDERARQIAYRAAEE
jgi:uncharacterized protein (DUF488 family)